MQLLFKLAPSIYELQLLQQHAAMRASSLSKGLFNFLAMK
jgi:hypothetical protein